MGSDPTRWVAAGSNEIDPEVLRMALQEVKKSTVRITPDWFDSYYHIEGKIPELTRRVFSLTEPAIDKEVEVKRALMILRLQSGNSESPQILSALLQGFLKPFAVKVAATCTAAVMTEHQDAQFAMMDYVALHRGDKVGYMPAVSAVTQTTDVTKEPDSDVHSSIAMTSAIETLNLLGCGVPSSFKIFPIYDGPSEELLDHIRSNLDAFTSRYNLAMEDYSSLKYGKLFYGATAMATTPKELPTRYESIEEGMDIFVTNSFGGLAPLGLMTLGLLDPDTIAKCERSGISPDSLAKAKDEAVKNLSEPHFALGKIVAKFLPDFGTTFDKNTHLTAVYPVGTRGVFALRDLSVRANTGLKVDTLPLKHEEISRFASTEYLMENSTASLNGCHILVAQRDVANLMMEELGKHNFIPQRIGMVLRKGAPGVTFDAETKIEALVASKKKLDSLLSPPVQQQTS